MRAALLYNPLLLLQRLGTVAEHRRRRSKLKHTVARNLRIGHIDTLELLELLREAPPKVIYDIGASAGTWTLLARSIFPKAEIHAFEPLKSHSHLFRIKTSGISKIYLHPVALGSAETEAAMNIADFSDASSLLEPSQAALRDFGVKTIERQKVSVWKLDDYITENSLPWPDLLKLDVQGYELEVLRGAQASLSHLSALISEVSFQEYYHDQPLFHDIVKFAPITHYSLPLSGREPHWGWRLNRQTRCS